ncbi:hypothetical protein PM082_004260 [Marasmius tenuissimus]|nr:hypothetical protein PM082_004260 [Marasmius tenuissimus]
MFGYQPRQNERYYWDFVIFKVEHELFKVPKHAFSNNPYPPFNKMFPANQEAADDAKETDKSPGASPENPIVLEEIHKVDFERFLSVLYPQFKPSHRNNNSEGLHESEIDTWLSVLKLSSQWNFIDIRKTAIERISEHTMSPASFNAFDRIVAGREYGVLQWFLDGVIAIAGAHTADISRGDAHKIVLGTALSLYHLKGRVRRVARDSTFGCYGSMDELKDERCLRRTLSMGISEYLANDLWDIISRARTYEHVTMDDILGGVGGFGGTVQVSVDGHRPFRCRWSIRQEEEFSIVLG